jgi:hypothetical protein
MVTIVKHEWHSHDRQYAIELDEDLLSEIYPDLNEDEIAQKLADIESGEIDVDEVMSDAYDNDVDIEWDFQYDDCWTDRKGGYDVTYELGDESSWVTPDTPPKPTHKCTKCKWTGQSYEGDWVWEDKNGKELEEGKQVCPYCESDLELTPEGVVKEEERKKRMAEIDAMFADEEDEE